MKASYFYRVGMIVSLIGGAVSSAVSQGSLQFNQVKLVTTQETVPSGKVWKVNTILPEFSALGSEFQKISPIAIEINDQKIEVGNTGHDHWQTSTRANGFINQSAIWLPSGSTLEASDRVKYISVTEFNVIP